MLPANPGVSHAPTDTHARPISDLPARTASRTRLAAQAVLALFLLLALTYSMVTPIFEGYDEHWHFAFVEHLTAGKGLPRQPASQYPHLANQEASQPPLYYLLAALVTAPLPQADLVAGVRLNPQFAAIPKDYQDNQNKVVHTAAEDFPYRGGVLAVHLARLLSALLGAGTVGCTYLLARRLFPGRPHLALGAMLLAGLTPGFLFASSVVDNDILVNFLASVALVLLVDIWHAPARSSRIAWLGVVLGCTALTKLSGLLMWPFAAGVLSVVAWRRRDGRWLLRAALTAFGLAVLICVWWYVRNVALYGNLTGLNQLLGLVPTREEGFRLTDVWNELQGLRRSYWGVFGWFNVAAPAWAYHVFDAFSALAAAGLVVGAVRGVRRWQRGSLGSSDRQLLGGVALAALWALVSFAGMVGYTLATPASTGRLLYPAAGCLSILLTVGLLAWFPRRAHAAVLGVLAAGLLLAAAAAPLLVIRPAYAKPALLPAAPAAPVAATFGSAEAAPVTLLSAELDRASVGPGELAWVKACWAGAQPIAADYLVFVQLLAEHDLIAAQKDTYHGLGTFPTSLWPPGAAFCDRYPLQVSETVPHGGPTQLLIGLYAPGGARLPAFDPAGQPLGDGLRVTGPAIVLPAAGRTLPFEWGHQVALVDYALSSTAVHPGESLALDLTWRSLRRTPANLAASVQVIDGQGRKIGQSDAPLPVAALASGALFADHRTVTLAADAQPGIYDLKVVVYDAATVENLLPYERGQVFAGGGLVKLWSILVPSR